MQDNIGHATPSTWRACTESRGTRTHDVTTIDTPTVGKNVFLGAAAATAVDEPATAYAAGMPTHGQVQTVPEQGGAEHALAVALDAKPLMRP